MTGTLAGGRKAAITIKERHGEDFYKRIGRKGGSLSRRGKAYGPVFAEKRKLILQLWYKDTPYSDIARQIGLPYSATRTWVRKYVEGKDA